MDLAEDPTLPDLLKSALWLEIRLDDAAWLFELKAGEERAVVVGSHLRADVRVRRPGVASMHFHFEREGEAVLIIPGYQAALRINSVRAPEPCSLDARATVEFQGVSLEVVTHRQRPSHVEASGLEGSAQDRPSSAEYLEGLPDETDPTGISVAAVAGHAPPLSLDTLDVVRAAWVTEEISRVTSDDSSCEAFPARDAPRVSMPGPALGPQGTVVMAPVQLRAEDVPSAVDAPSSTARLRPQHPEQWITERILAPAPAPAVERVDEVPHRTGPDSTPTRLESPAARRSKPPVPLVGQATVMLSSPPSFEPPAGEELAAPAQAAVVTARAPLSPVPVRPAPLSIENQASQRTADFDVASMAPFFVTPPSGVVSPSRGGSPAAVLPEAPPAPFPRPTTSSTPPMARNVSRGPAPPNSWLVLLGHVAKRSPLLVGAGALGSTIVLTLALVGASRLLPAAGNNHRAAFPSRATSALATHLAAPSARPRPVPTSIGIAPTPATPLSSSARSPGKGSERTGSAPADPELAQAVGHLTAGRFAEAESAYQRLSARDPQNPAYAAVYRMLRESAAARCSMKPPASGCPEVKP